MNFKIIDCVYFSDKISAHNEIKRVLSFPNYYGNNLDALWDMLTSITSETIIVLANTKYVNDDCKGIIDTFEEAAGENERVRIVNM